MTRIGSILISLLLGSAAAADDAAVPFPEGWRSWRHVKSMVIQPGHPLHASFGGIHHLYANGKGLQGYQSGRFPDGAVIVFDLLEAIAAGNAVQEGPRKVLGVMLKDVRRFPDTGGWGFEGFAAGDPERRAVGGNAKTACFDCHLGQKDRDFVFSEARD